MGKSKWAGLQPLQGESATRKGRVAVLSKGLFATSDPKSIDLGGSPEMDGIRFEQGGIAKDFGFSSVGLTATEVFCIWNHGWIDAVSPYQHSRTFRIAEAGDGKVYMDMWSGVNWSYNILYATLPSSLFQFDSTLPVMRSVLDTLILCSGGSAIRPIMWNDPADTLDVIMGTSLGIRDVIPFAERAVYLGGVSDPQGIYYSISGDVTDLTGAGSGSTTLIGSTSHPIDAIRGGAVLGENLIIFRQRSITRGFRTGNIQVSIGFKPWMKGTGTESQKSIVPGASGIFFFGHDKMPYHLSMQGLRPIGSNIYEYLAHVIDEDDLVYVESVYDKNNQILMIGIPESGAGSITAILKFDMGKFIRTGEEAWTYQTLACETMAYTTEDV